MSGGVFIILAILAVIIGSKARSTKIPSPKNQANREKLKRFLLYLVFALTILILLFFIPAYIEELIIAHDTHYSLENLLGFILIGVASFTLFTTFKKLRIKH